MYMIMPTCLMAKGYSIFFETLKMDALRGDKLFSVTDHNYKITWPLLKEL